MNGEQMSELDLESGVSPVGSEAASAGIESILRERGQSLEVRSELEAVAEAEQNGNTQLTACEAYLPESGCGGGGIGLHACGLAARTSPPQLVQNKNQEGLATTTAQTASKDAPAHQIHLAGPQSKKGKRPQLLRRRQKTLPPTRTTSLGSKAKKGKRPQLLRRRQKTLPPTKSRSLGPKARRASDRNCSDGVKRHSQPPNRARWAPKQEGLASATAQTASKDAPAHQIHIAGPQSKNG